MSHDRQSLNVLHLTSYAIFQQLQLEEALLRTDDGNWCVVNEGSSPAIIMGISGKQENLINGRLLSQYPIPIIRRFSGGGCVFVDEKTIFVTLICHRKAIDIPHFPQQVLRWLGEFYRQALPGLDFSVKENDYVIGNRKFGGNAQYFRKDRWLHHSSLLWDFHPKNMDYLRMPEKIPRYRQKREHKDFLCKLSDFLPSQHIFVQRFLQSVSKYFTCRDVPIEEAKAYLLNNHRKSTKRC